MQLRVIAMSAAAVLLAGLPAGAQQAVQPITWVSYDMVKPGKMEQAVELAKKYDGPQLDKLVADGTILSWGLATLVTHESNFKWNILTWVTLPGWANVDKWVGVIMQQMRSRSAAENKAIEDEHAAVYVERSHFDEVLRNVMLSPQAAGGAAPRYILAGMYKVKPGQGEAAQKAFAPWWPAIDKLKANGTVIAYGLQRQDLHSDPSFSVRDWYMLPNLAAVDAITQAAETSWSADNEAAFTAAFENEPHRDVILMILHLGGQRTP
jgi:hypothetical protein